MSRWLQIDRALPLATGLIVSLMAGAMLEGMSATLFLFGVAGLAAGGMAIFQPRGSERVYWGFVVLELVLTMLSAFGMNFSRWFFVLPIVFIVSYFVTRLVLKLAGRKPA